MTKQKKITIAVSVEEHLHLRGLVLQRMASEKKFVSMTNLIMDAVTEKYGKSEGNKHD